ncbi:hypothetical protein KAR04_00145 [Candidatus Calescamantes bacterium]|nr:hypothetical protein [Candidatus Calescamantes bacterium]
MVVTDTDWEDFDDLDNFGISICLSSTRPTAHEGRHIYEIDTNKTMVYTGAAWEEISGNGGDFYADGSVPMTGDLDLGENYLRNGKIWPDLYDGDFRPNLVLPSFGDTLYYSVERGATVSANTGPDAGILSDLFNLDNNARATWNNVSTSNPILTINWGTDRFVNAISIIHGWRDSQLTNAVIEIYEDNNDDSVYQWTTLETITGNTDYIVMVSCGYWRVKQIRITVTSSGSGDQTNNWSVGTIQAMSSVHGRGSGHLACLGSNTFYDDQDMDGNKITGLAAATANGEAVRYEQLTGAYLLLTGGTMSGNIVMGDNDITGANAIQATASENLTLKVSTGSSIVFQAV